MFQNIPRTIDVNGEQMLIASVIRRGGALAVDLCAGVLLGMAAMWVVSRGMPLDSPQAQVPIVIIVLAVAVYLVWARDRVLPSLGRHVFGLRLVRAGGGVPGALARPLTVYQFKSNQDELARTASAVAMVVTTSMVAVYLFASAITTTQVFQAALSFTDHAAPFTSKYGDAPVLDRLPRAMLVGEHRAFVQIAASWGSQTGAIEYFLERDRPRDPWKVTLARESEMRFYGNYGLKVPDHEVPQP